MNKKMLFALLLIAVLAVILVYNSMGTGRNISVDLVLTQIRTVKSLVFLAFIASGVVIGVLLK